MALAANVSASHKELNLHAQRILLCISDSFHCSTHCKENTIYVFPEKKLRDLSPNFRIHVSVSDLHIPTIRPPIFLQQNRQTDHGNTKIAQRNTKVGPGNEAAQFHFSEFFFKFSG